MTNIFLIRRKIKIYLFSRLTFPAFLKIMAEPLIRISYKQTLIFAGFFVLYEFLTYVANDMIMPGMVEVAHLFNAPETSVASSLTAYILGGASLQLFLGPLSDRFGRRPILIFGVGFFFICTILLACSQSMPYFLMVRFFQGMGLCFIMIGYAAIQEIFREMDAIRLIAILVNVATTAPLLGPLIGAIIMNNFSWRFIFFSIAAFTLLPLLGLWRFMPETVGQVDREGKYLAPMPLKMSSILNNYRRLILNKQYFFHAIAFGFIGLSCMTWIALGPVIMIKQANLSYIQFGLWQIPVFSSAIIGSWVLQFLTYRHFSIKALIKLGSSFIVLSSFLCVFSVYLAKGHFLGLVPPFMLYFFGLGLSTAPLERLILFCTPIGKGTATALLTLMTMLLQALGIEFANILYAHFNQSNLAFAFLQLCIALLYLLFLSAGFVYQKKVNPTEVSPE